MNCLMKVLNTKNHYLLLLQIMGDESVYTRNFRIFVQTFYKFKTILMILLVYYSVFIILLLMDFLIINIVGALEEYEYDMTIMILKIKWTNYFLEIPLIYLVAFAFNPVIE